MRSKLVAVREKCAAFPAPLVGSAHGDLNLANLLLDAYEGVPEHRGRTISGVFLQQCCSCSTGISTHGDTCPSRLTASHAFAGARRLAQVWIIDPAQLETDRAAPLRDYAKLETCFTLEAIPLPLQVDVEQEMLLAGTEPKRVKVPGLWNSFSARFTREIPITKSFWVVFKAL